MFPLKNQIKIDDIPLANRFAAKRRYDIHTGVDLFCPDGTEVYAIEDGIVTNVAKFTGASIGMPWWAETWCVLVEGKSGVFLYGELYEPDYVIGDIVFEGSVIGNIKTVLLKDKGLPMSMLHIEWYEPGYRGNWDWWYHDQPMPKSLKNIEEILNWEK